MRFKSWLPSVILPALGCAAWLPAPVPMHSVSDTLPTGKARCLVVLFPGRGDHAETFVEEGFVAALRQSGLSIDIVATDATLGYYAKNTLVDRLATDVFGPWLAHGYEQVWAIGNSMGGLGTMLYSLKRPGQINGVLMLAPYLGDRSLIKEIHDSGGLAKWQAPPEEPITEDTYQRQLWRWLQRVTNGTEKGPDLYVGVGTDDRFKRSVELLAADLPADHSWQAPGGHDWPVWRELLKHFLQDSDFTKACSPSQ